MSKVINAYETIFVLSTKNGDEKINELVEKFTTLISSNGTIDSTDLWGKRRLAYAINDEIEGYYVLVNFSCETEFLTDLDRIYKITDGVLRSLIIKKDK